MSEPAPSSGSGRIMSPKIQVAAISIVSAAALWAVARIAQTRNNGAQNGKLSSRYEMSLGSNPGSSTIEGQVIGETRIRHLEGTMEATIQEVTEIGNLEYSVECAVRDNRWLIELPQSFAGKWPARISVRIDSLLSEGHYLLVSFAGRVPGEFVRISMHTIQVLHASDLPSSPVAVVEAENHSPIPKYYVANGRRSSQLLEMPNAGHPGIEENIQYIAKDVEGLWDARSFPFDLAGPELQSLWVGAESKTWSKVLIDWKNGGQTTVVLHEAGRLKIEIPQVLPPGRPFLVITSCPGDQLYAIEPIPIGCHEVHMRGLGAGCYGVEGYLLMADVSLFPDCYSPVRVDVLNKGEVNVILTQQEFNVSEW